MLLQSSCCSKNLFCTKSSLTECRSFSCNQIPGGTFTQGLVDREPLSLSLFLSLGGLVHTLPFQHGRHIVHLFRKTSTIEYLYCCSDMSFTLVCACTTRRVASENRVRVLVGRISCGRRCRIPATGAQFIPNASEPSSPIIATPM